MNTTKMTTLGKKSQTRGAMVFIVLLSIVLISIAIASPTQTVYVANASANFGDVIRIPINVSAAADIGSMDIQLRYDSGILSLQKVENGTLTGSSTIQHNIENGLVRIGLIDQYGINGAGSVITLTFTVWGFPGSTSILDLEATANNVTDFSPIPLTVLDGIFTVAGSMENISVLVTVPDISANYGSIVEIPINISSSLLIGSMDITFIYDSSVLILKNISKGSLTKNSLIETNTNVDGIIDIAIADSQGFNGTGSVIVMRFLVGSYSKTSPLTLETVVANDFNTGLEIPVVKRNGLFTATGAEFATVNVTVGNFTGDYGGTVTIPINVSTSVLIGSMDIVFKYNPSLLLLRNITAGTLTGNSLIQTNTNVDGEVRIALADSQGINGSGSVVVMTFMIGFSGASSPLTLDTVIANDFNTGLEIPVKRVNGVFTATGLENVTVNVSVDNFSSFYRTEISVPINVSTNVPIGSMDIVFKYNPNILMLKNINKGSLTTNSMIQTNTDVDGVIRFAIADSQGFNGTGSVAILTFSVWGYYGDSSPLTLENVIANDYKTYQQLPVNVRNGLFTVSGPILGWITVSTINITGPIGSSLQVPINASGAINLGSMDVILLFDSNVLNATNITKGNLVSGSYFESKINPGNVSIAVVNENGINGSGTVAVITFVVVGYARSETPLSLRVEANEVNTFAPIPVRRIDGIFKDLITLTAPNGGEIWYNTQNVTWTTASKLPGFVSPALNFTVDITLYDAYSYRTIISNLSDNGFYEWNTKRVGAYDVPDGTTYKIKVKAIAGNMSSYDESEKWFTIYNTREVVSSVAPNAQTTTEGANATYWISIFNKQPYNDTFDLVINNPNNASVAKTNRNNLTLAAWETKIVILNITDANVGNYNVSVDIVSRTNA
ncbi:MAG: hypothetical protein HZC29_08370, partial [Thaumarchaeota archaeon]|nr:hypothetical protein [Nitrososphaerota archaeon]